MAGRDLSSDGYHLALPEELRCRNFDLDLGRAHRTLPLCSTQRICHQSRPVLRKKIAGEAMATDVIPAIETVLGGGTCFGTEVAQTA